VHVLSLNLFALTQVSLFHFFSVECQHMQWSGNKKHIHLAAQKQEKDQHKDRSDQHAQKQVECMHAFTLPFFACLRACTCNFFPFCEQV